MDFTLAFAAACLLVGLSKGGLIGPIGGTVALPLLVQATFGGEQITVQEATGVLLVMLMIGDVIAIPIYWREWEIPPLRLAMPAAVIGIVLGTWVLVSLDSRTLKHVLGVLTLVIVAYKVFNAALARWMSAAVYQHRNWHGYLAGFLSGIGSALANTGGPPMTAYLLLQKQSPRAFVGTMAVFFLIVNWLKIPGYIGGGVFSGLDMIADVWWALLLIPVTVVICRPIIHRVNREVFDWFITALLVWAALGLLVQ